MCVCEAVNKHTDQSMRWQHFSLKTKQFLTVPGINDVFMWLTSTSRLDPIMITLSRHTRIPLVVKRSDVTIRGP